MRKLFLPALLLLAAGCTKDEVITDGTENSKSEPVYPTGLHIYEYTPAPGQFIGDPQSGGMTSALTTMEEACRWAEERLAKAQFVSLGGFGGFIVAGLGEKIVNSEGGDFTIYGNAFLNEGSLTGGSNEPGIVYVMRDDNRNGLPDDTWYELAGSDSLDPTTIRNYTVTYIRPTTDKTSIPWHDSLGETGEIRYVEMFHAQPSYWPAWIDAEEITLSGTRLAPHTSLSNSGRWDNSPYAWGYADNVGSDAVESGALRGTRFDISNAIDASGKSVKLDHIDFIKVQTGVNSNSGPLGEISTEITGIKIE